MAAGYVHARRVDPADMAIRPAVNQVDAAVPGMAEHQDRAGSRSPAGARARAAHGAAPVETCLSRRRCTEEGIRIASRYFATVRRAMSMPAARNLSTIVSSDRTAW